MAKKTKVTIKAKKKGKKGSAKKKKDLFGVINVPEELTDRGREIWLAGLGAFSTAEKEGVKVFRNLVQKGEKWETSGRKSIGKAKKSIDDAATQASGLDDKARAAVNEAVEGGLKRLGVPSSKEVKDLSAKVDKLAAQVAALASAVGEKKKTRKPRAAKSDAKKAKATTASSASASSKASSNGAERAVYHVVPRDDRWAVQKEGNERASSLHDAKNDALAAGRDLAKNQEPSQLIVHKSDGTIQTSYTYGGEENGS